MKLTCTCGNEFEMPKYWQGVCEDCNKGFYWDRVNEVIVWAENRRERERRQEGIDEVVRTALKEMADAIYEDVFDHQYDLCGDGWHIIKEVQKVLAQFVPRENDK